LLDPQNLERSIEDQLNVLLNELKTYDSSLLEKSIWLSVNKKDTLDEKRQKELIELIKKKMLSLNLDYEGIIAISGFTGDDTETLLGMIANKMLESKD
jgi:GTPase involved in cell partitioning and DNA repair